MAWKLSMGAWDAVGELMQLASKKRKSPKLYKSLMRNKFSSFLLILGVQIVLAWASLKAMAKLIDMKHKLEKKKEQKQEVSTVNALGITPARTQVANAITK